MIVFPQGAVLRLTEPVSEGQILILKNPRVKQEVACRVVSSKTNASAKGYIEVEFFQAAPGFWGITFPAATPSASRTESAPSAAAPKQPRIEPSAVKPAFFQPPAAPKSPAPVASNAPVAPAISKPAPVPVPVAPAAVISQPPVSAPAPEPIPVSATPVSTSPAPAAPVAQASVAPPLTPDSTQELNRAIAAAYAAPVEPAKPVKKAEPVQEAKPVKEAVIAPSVPSPSISDSFPLTGSKSLNPTKPKSAPVTVSREAVSSPEPLATADSIGYPAPQVSTNAPSISSIKVNRKSASSSSIETRKIELTSSQIASEAVVGKAMFSSGAEASGKQESSSGRTWMIAAAAVVLIGAGAGTYWWKTSHKLGAAKSDSVSAAAPANTASGVAGASAQPVSAPTGTGSQPATNPASTQNSAANQKSGLVAGGSATNSVAARPDKSPAIVTSRRPNVLPAEKIAAPVAHSTASSIVATPAPEVASKTANVPAASLSSILPGMGQPSSLPAPPSPSRPSGPPPSASVLQQPRLLQSSTPIYPKIAATRGDWGDVVIDALVSESGKVTDAKVISGPDTLRQSALQVVRTQTYQPAKLNGKPVSMHVTVKVPFPKPR